jgi:hypothetical protein
MKEMDLLLPTASEKTVHLERTRRSKSKSGVLYICTTIQDKYKGCEDTAFSRY